MLHMFHGMAFILSVSELESTKLHFLSLSFFIYFGIYKQVQTIKYCLNEISEVVFALT